MLFIVDPFDLEFPGSRPTWRC